MRIQRHLWLQQFKLQPDGAQFLTAHKIIIGKGQPVGRGPRLRRVGNILCCGAVVAGLPQGVAF